MLDTVRPISIPHEGGLFAAVTETTAGRSGLVLAFGIWLAMMTVRYAAKPCHLSLPDDCYCILLLTHRL